MKCGLPTSLLIVNKEFELLHNIIEYVKEKGYKDNVE